MRGARVAFEDRHAGTQSASLVAGWSDKVTVNARRRPPPARNADVMATDHGAQGAGGSASRSGLW